MISCSEPSFGWCFQILYVLCSPQFEKIPHFDDHIFQRGCFNHLDFQDHTPNPSMLIVRGMKSLDKHHQGMDLVLDLDAADPQQETWEKTVGLFSKGDFFTFFFNRGIHHHDKTTIWIDNMCVCI